MQQYLIPTPEGEQPDLELVYLVVNGEFIPSSVGDQFTIVETNEEEEDNSGPFVVTA